MRIPAERMALLLCSQSVHQYSLRGLVQSLKLSQKAVKGISLLKHSLIQQHINSFGNCLSGSFGMVKAKVSFQLIIIFEWEGWSSGEKQKI